jgi:hypothetical protein
MLAANIAASRIVTVKGDPARAPDHGVGLLRWQQQERRHFPRALKRASSTTCSVDKIAPTFSKLCGSAEIDLGIGHAGIQAQAVELGKYACQLSLFTRTVGA